MSSSSVTVTSLDHTAIARKWVEAFEDLEVRMLLAIKPYLADDFELMCPGDSTLVPFAGIWKGTAGHQEWLNLFFGFFKRTKAKDVKFTSTDNTVEARWLEHVTLQGIPCTPVRINLYFHFWDGKLARIFDDYDTQTGTANIANLLGR